MNQEENAGPSENREIINALEKELLRCVKNIEKLKLKKTCFSVDFSTFQDVELQHSALCEKFFLLTREEQRDYFLQVHAYREALLKHQLFSDSRKVCATLRTKVEKVKEKLGKEWIDYLLLVGEGYFEYGLLQREATDKSYDEAIDYVGQAWRDAQFFGWEGCISNIKRILTRIEVAITFFSFKNLFTVYDSPPSYNLVIEKEFFTRFLCLMDGLASFQEFGWIDGAYNFSREYFLCFLGTSDSLGEIAKKLKSQSLLSFNDDCAFFLKLICQICTHRRYSLVAGFLMSLRSTGLVDTTTVEDEYRKFRKKNDPSLISGDQYMPYWVEYYNSLYQHRAVFRESLSKADFLIHQRTFNDAVRDLLRKIITSTAHVFGCPPCYYEVVLIGSFARNEGGPYSDFEIFILIDDPQKKSSPYFTQLIRLLRYQVFLLTDVVIECDSTLVDEKFSGLHLDGGLFEPCPGTRQPILPVRLKSILIQGKEELCSWVFEYLTVSSKSDNEDSLAFSCLHTEIIYRGKPNLTAKFPDLLLGYHQLLKKKLKEKDRKHRAVLYFKKDKILLVEKKAPSNSKENSLKLLSDLKEDALKPLSLFCLSLGLYFDVRDTATGGFLRHPMDVLDQLVARNILNAAWVKTVKWAYEKIQLLRCAEQFKRGGRPDELDQTFPSGDRKFIEMVRTYLIYPAFEWATEVLPDPILPLATPLDPAFKLLERIVSADSEKNLKEISTFLMNFFIFHSFFRNRSRTEWKRSYAQLQENHSLQVQMIHALNSQLFSAMNKRDRVVEFLKNSPNSDGWTYSGWVRRGRWRQQVLQDFGALGSAGDAGQATVSLVGPNPIGDGGVVGLGKIKKCPLPLSLEEQLLTKEADGSWILKPKPAEQAGRHTVLPVKNGGVLRYWVKCYPENPGMEYAIEQLQQRLCGVGTPMSYIAKLTLPGGESVAIHIIEHIRGDSLLIHYKKERPGTPLDEISIASYTRAFLRVLLIRPPDDRAEDYLMQREPTGDYSLFRIDNERAFVNKVWERKIFRKNELKLLSVIYDLPQKNKPLDPVVLEYFLQLNPLEVLNGWLADLICEAARYEQLFDDALVREHLQRRGKSGRSRLKFLLPADLAYYLLNRLYRIRFEIEEMIKSGETVTGDLLLARVEWEVSTAYSLPRTHYDALSSPSTKSVRSQAGSIVPQDVQKEFLSIRTVNLEEMIQNFLAGRVKKNQFNKLLEKDRAFVLMQVAKKIEAGGVEVQFTKKAEGVFLECLCDVPFYILSFQEIGSKISASVFSRIIKRSGQELKVLDLTGCDVLIDNVEFVAECCPQLRALKISGHGRLRDLCAEQLFVFDDLESLNKLVFRSLQVLVVFDCPELEVIRLETPRLQYLSVEKCPKLKVLEIDKGELRECRITRCKELKGGQLIGLTGDAGQLETLVLPGNLYKIEELLSDYPFLMSLPRSCFNNKNKVYPADLCAQLGEVFRANDVVPLTLDPKTRRVFVDRLKYSLAFRDFFPIEKILCLDNEVLSNALPFLCRPGFLNEEERAKVFERLSKDSDSRVLVKVASSLNVLSGSPITSKLALKIFDRLASDKACDVRQAVLVNGIGFLLSGGSENFSTIMRFLMKIIQEDSVDICQKKALSRLAGFHWMCEQLAVQTDVLTGFFRRLADNEHWQIRRLSATGLDVLCDRQAVEFEFLKKLFNDLAADQQPFVAHKVVSALIPLSQLEVREEVGNGEGSLCFELLNEFLEFDLDQGHVHRLETAYGRGLYWEMIRVLYVLCCREDILIEQLITSFDKVVFHKYNDASFETRVLITLILKKICERSQGAEVQTAMLLERFQKFFAQGNQSVCSVASENLPWLYLLSEREGHRPLVNQLFQGFSVHREVAVRASSARGLLTLWSRASGLPDQLFTLLTVLAADNDLGVREFIVGELDVIFELIPIVQSTEQLINLLNLLILDFEATIRDKVPLVLAEFCKKNMGTPEDVLPLFRQLASDLHPNVRLSLVASLPDLCVRQDITVEDLFDLFGTLSADRSSQVQQALASNLGVLAVNRDVPLNVWRDIFINFTRSPLFVVQANSAKAFSLALKMLAETEEVSSKILSDLFGSLLDEPSVASEAVLYFPELCIRNDLPRTIVKRVLSDFHQHRVVDVRKKLAEGFVLLCQWQSTPSTFLLRWLPCFLRDQDPAIASESAMALVPVSFREDISISVVKSFFFELAKRKEAIVQQALAKILRGLCRANKIPEDDLICFFDHFVSPEIDMQVLRILGKSLKALSDREDITQETLSDVFNYLGIQGDSCLQANLLECLESICQRDRISFIELKQIFRVIFSRLTIDNQDSAERCLRVFCERVDIPGNGLAKFLDELVKIRKPLLTRVLAVAFPCLCQRNDVSSGNIKSLLALFFEQTDEQTRLTVLRRLKEIVFSFNGSLHSVLELIFDSMIAKGNKQIGGQLLSDLLNLLELKPLLSGILTVFKRNRDRGFIKKPVPSLPLRLILFRDRSQSERVQPEEDCPDPSLNPAVSSVLDPEMVHQSVTRKKTDWCHKRSDELKDRPTTEAYTCFFKSRFHLIPPQVGNPGPSIQVTSV